MGAGGEFIEHRIEESPAATDTGGGVDETDDGTDDRTACSAGNDEP
ncbi:unnamed protein product [Nippostrongylus brasiliensis]|uniref:Ribonuclease n=1 Tax=Nippostrongylus brasiliensis TaxID=27835 RepID=A0A0N4YTF6_NIPBR|nr:unnamed protein product [Nippostrongylus brasiliensis]